MAHPNAIKSPRVALLEPPSPVPRAGTPWADLSHKMLIVGHILGLYLPCRGVLVHSEIDHSRQATARINKENRAERRNMSSHEPPLTKTNKLKGLAERKGLDS